MCGAVRVLTEMPGFQQVLVGDVAHSSGGELMWFGPVNTLGLEDGEGVCGVWRALQERCKVDVNGRRSLWLRVEMRTSAVPQFGR